MDKFVIHIHLYLTSTETELTAFNNLKRLKSNGFKILITSPKLIPLYFYQYIDHFYYDNENQMMELEYKKANSKVNSWINKNNYKKIRSVARPNKYPWNFWSAKWSTYSAIFFLKIGLKPNHISYFWFFHYNNLSK